MARNNQRGSNNNNPEGRNQYSNGWMDSARERPFTAAVGAAAAVGAGVFLWSRRNQISDQISSLSDQISEWSESRGSGDPQLETADASSDFSSKSGTSSTRSTGSAGGRSRTQGMSPTGGGNASLDTQTGGKGIGGGAGSGGAGA